MPKKKSTLQNYILDQIAFYKPGGHPLNPECFVEMEVLDLPTCPRCSYYTGEKCSILGKVTPLILRTCHSVGYFYSSQRKPNKPKAWRRNK